VTSSTSPLPSTLTPPPPIINYRLPANLKPTLYELTIKPYIGTNETYGDKAFTYEGTMKMTFDCLNATNKIIFHTLEQKINSSKLVLLNGDGSPSGLSITSTDIDLLRDFFIINLNGACIQSQNYVLVVEYTGVIRVELNGFYRSSYLASNGETR